MLGGAGGEGEGERGGIGVGGRGDTPRGLREKKLQWSKEP